MFDRHWLKLAVLVSSSGNSRKGISVSKTLSVLTLKAPGNERDVFMNVGKKNNPGLACVCNFVSRAAPNYLLWQKIRGILFTPYRMFNFALYSPDKKNLKEIFFSIEA